MGLWHDIADAVDMARGRYLYKYSPLPDRNPAAEAPQPAPRPAPRPAQAVLAAGLHRATALWSSLWSSLWPSRSPRALRFIMSAVALVLVVCLVALSVRATQARDARAVCDTPQHGFQCSGSVSHFWGQYSPYFSVPSEIDSSVPAACRLTFAQILSRHGARDPTASKTTAYSSTINRIKASATSYGPGYEFIRNYTYALGADQLTAFGQQEMVNSGLKFYSRYAELARSASPFVRSSGQDRVLESAQNWTQGFHAARLADDSSDGPDDFPYAIVTIPQDAGSNNTLSHGLCTAFETGPDSEMGGNAQSEWMGVFTRNITARLNANLPGANVSAVDTVYLMDLCPFHTVASAGGGELSPFCGLFAQEEWRGYDYLQTLGKWYGYGPGNPLGPTQGVGWVNELVARLTGRAVADHTSTNRTLDGDPVTFPLGRALYADFSHDNDMAAITAALGLYGAAPPLSNTTLTGPADAGGFSASWTVPFAARVYVEKMRCGGAGGAVEVEEEEEELVRVLVNDRVAPLQGCGADALGRCTLTRFVESLGFARSGGDWASCFT